MVSEKNQILIKQAVENLAKHNIKTDDILNYIRLDKQTEHQFNKEKTADITIPATVFANDSLSALESITKYLRENLKFRNITIAKALNRDARTISHTYKIACKKHPKQLKTAKTGIIIPVSIFSERKLSMLESLVFFLKTEHNMTLAGIARILFRDQRTIWTVMARARKKKNEQ